MSWITYLLTIIGSDVLPQNILFLLIKWSWVAPQASNSGSISYQLWETAWNILTLFITIEHSLSTNHQVRIYDYLLNLVSSRTKMTIAVCAYHCTDNICTEPIVGIIPICKQMSFLNCITLQCTLTHVLCMYSGVTLDITACQDKSVPLKTYGIMW